MITNLKNYFFLFFLCVTFSCSETKRECETILECQDNTLWSLETGISYWRIFDDPSGIYLDVHFVSGDCIEYQTPSSVNASFIFQDKNSFIEKYDDKEWIYFLVNDTVLERSRATGGSTSYLYKKPVELLDVLLDNYDFCY